MLLQRIFRDLPNSRHKSELPSLTYSTFENVGNLSSIGINYLTLQQGVDGILFM